MTELIKAVEATAASSGRGLDVVSAPPYVTPTRTEAAPPSAAGGTDADSVQQAIDAMSEQLAAHNVTLNYHVDPDLNRVIVEVVDQQDGSVLRQIPGEEVVRLARMMQSGQGGLLRATV